MKNFKYHGTISSSKSLFNRALIIHSYQPKIEIQGYTLCEDVTYMKSSLKEMFAKQKINCLHAGTILRFISFRASRIPGKHFITGSDRLLERPHQEIKNILNNLGVNIFFHNNDNFKGIEIDSSGWQKPLKPLEANLKTSSQYLSGLLLNSWDLPFPLEINLTSEQVSTGYLQMTLNLLEYFGMKWEKTNNKKIIVPPYQKPLPKTYQVEMDLSSAFSIASLGALFGEVKLYPFPQHTLQPDKVFPDLLKQMGVEIIVENFLWVRKAKKLLATEINIKNCPDLFPVLSILCAFADGTSKIYGAPHLIYKESNRIKKVIELLDLIGIFYKKIPDGLIISGENKISENKISENKNGEIFEKNQNNLIEFDPDNDHRIAMAAGILKFAGFPIQINSPEVVNKSFPEFWQILKIN